MGAIPKKQTVQQTDVYMNQVRKNISRSQDFWIRIRKNRTAMIGLAVFTLIVLMALIGPLFLDYDLNIVKPNLPERLQGPSREHILGTDELGRDMLNRIIYGARVSLGVGFVAVIIGVTFGTVIGAVSGYYGGVIDNVIMRVIDIFAAIPNLLLAITIAAALGQNIFNLMLAIGISGVPMLSRVVRASVLTIKGQDFIEAGRAMGARNYQIIIYHIIPNCIAPIIVQATLRIAGAILATSSLSFLGLGVKPPMPEWGNILSSGRDFLRDAGHITLFPGLFIMITVLSANLLGDGLRDALDPKLKR